MKKKVLFGAGSIGAKALELIKKEDIAFFIDSSLLRAGEKYHGFDVFCFESMKNKLNDYEIIITVSKKYEEQIVLLLRESGLLDYMTFHELLKNFQELEIVARRKKVEERTDYIAIYNKAIRWILNHTVDGEAIINNTHLEKGYPEVTGYYIPTLLRWGYRDMALSFAEWLCGIQKSDGSWHDTYDAAPYVFDTV